MSASDGRPGGAGSALLGLLAVAMIAGVMVTVGVAPAIALTGVAAKNTIASFENLPSDLTIANLQQKTEIYAQLDGKPHLLTSFYNQDREVIAWDDVPATVKNAAVAGEDVRFYQHGGVDPMGILRAVVANAGSGNSQGASTISQQYVKNICVQEAELLSTQKLVDAAYEVCTQGSVVRKLKEARLAIGLEKKYSKDQILLGYLNIAGFGGQIYGIETAAQYYYDKHAKDLTTAEAASLVAIVNDPNVLRIDEKSNIADNTVRRDYILGVELKHHMLTQEEYQKAIATPVKPKVTPSRAGCQGAGVSGYFCDYVTHIVKQNPAFGKTPGARYNALVAGGLKIYTTLNLNLQRKAQKTMNQYVPMKSPVGNIASAATTVEVGTGRVLTMVQSKIYNNEPGSKYTAINYNTDEAYGGSHGFQPGSTYKLFTLVDWLKQGHGLYESVDGNARTIPASNFTQCKKPYNGEAWSVGNDAAGEGGYRSVFNGTQLSVNGVFASMAEKLDLCDIRDTAKAFGVHRADKAPLEMYPNSIIGTNTVAPISMATAYAGMANNGMTCTPIAIDKVVKPDGSQIQVPTSTCKQSVDKQVAIAANSALHGVITGGTMAGDATPDGVYEIGKTGTTDDAYDTWAIGASSKVATAIWVGSVTGHVNLREVRGFPACSYDGGIGKASDARHCLWKDMMTANNAVYPGATSWQQPLPRYLYGKQTTVPTVGGMSVDQAKNVLASAGFRGVVGSPEASDTVEKDKVSSTSPGGGAQASAGAAVTLHLSSGPAPQTPPMGQPDQNGNVTVPNVTRMQFGQAQQTLQQAGLQVGAVFKPITPNHTCFVYGQSPAQGQAPKQSTVTIAVDGDPGQCH
jgi:membrane peptidoglycan carboxypeptidase